VSDGDILIHAGRLCYGAAEYKKLTRFSMRDPRLPDPGQL
jgi:hypothetical protein